MSLPQTDDDEELPIVKSAKPERRPVKHSPPPVIHAIAPSDQGFTHLLCQPTAPIGEYRHTSHPELLTSPAGEMFSPNWTLITCIKCDQTRLAARADAVYALVADHLRTVGSATTAQIWEAVRYHPIAKQISLSRGILQITLKALSQTDPPRLSYDEAPAPNASGAMAYWYKLP